ncbi:carbon-nitrogen hydrolase [Blakeslea trispora]|nr:carbon-nitrogen hydrolase [Blakeslea trispora]
MNSFLLFSYQPGDIDLLVLPEMAFTGYVFKTKEEIEPFLEDEETGPSVQWAQSQGNLFCSASLPEPYYANYNSLCFVDPNGNRVLTYQKSFLYETDESWASEGPGFVSTQLEALDRAVGFGICMDLNPYQFKSSFYQFEFANYHLQHQTDLICCSMAWLKGSTDPVQYWATRLLPLSLKQSPTLFVVCNRTGSERGSTFAGSSCVLEIQSEQVTVLGQLEEHASAVLLVKIE